MYMPKWKKIISCPIILLKDAVFVITTLYIQLVDYFQNGCEVFSNYMKLATWHFSEVKHVCHLCNL